MRTRGAQRFVATILFTDVVGSTETAAGLGDRRWGRVVRDYYEVARGEVKQHGGREIDTAGDGFFAAFDTPEDGVQAAIAIIDRMWKQGVPIRAGLHTGQCERIGSKVGGIAVHIGARVASLAEGGEILVTGTVRDLAAGSGLRFDPRGTKELRGVPGDWSVFGVVGKTERVPLPALPESEEPEEPAPRWRRRVPILAGAAVILAGAVSALLLANRGSSPPVAAHHHAPKPFVGLVGFDAKTGHLVGRVALRFSAEPVTETHDLEPGAGFLWVADWGDDAIYKVNPSDDQTVWQSETVLAPLGILPIGNDLWVLGTRGIPPQCPCQLVHIDGLKNSVVSRLDLSGICCGGFVTDRGRAWILGPDELFRIDRATGRVAKFAPVGGDAVTVGAGRIWVLSQLRGNVTPVDEETGHVGEPISIAGNPARLAFGYGALWVVDTTGEQVERVPLGGNGSVQFVPVGKQPTDVAVGAGHVWVTSVVSGTVTEIEPTGATIVATIPALGSPSRIVVVDGTVWVADTPPF